MMRSMFSGVSGMRIHQTKMDVIANNISNVNTVGFKSSRVTFNEIFSQTISGASAANNETGRGGVSPMQIGLGANVASIDMKMTQGAAQRTDNPYDLMIQGDNFFIVGDNSGVKFTRAGTFKLDESNNLVTTSGLRVYGWDTQLDATTGKQKVVQTAVKPIAIGPDKQITQPKPTTMIDFTGNLNAASNAVQGNTMAFYDTVGNRYVADVEFTYNGATWDYKVKTSTARLDGDSTGKVFNLGGDQSGAITFDEYGKITQVGGAPNTTSVEITLTPPGTGMTPKAQFGGYGGNVGKVLLDFTSITQHGNDPTGMRADARDGKAKGILNGISIGPDGTITGSYSNSDMVILGQIATAKFKNSAGLEKVGDNLFIPTPNSGEFDGKGESVNASGGKIQAGVLEMSNVDLAAEFTEMITTQRGFQANSRVITTSDDMLQELVNLKR